MEIPIYENEAPAGTLRVSRQGLYTVFETLLSPAPALSRLWLGDGAGRIAPLGLLEPGRDGRRLCRRLTRLDCRALPPKPVFALALPAGERPSASDSPRLPLWGRCPSAHTGAYEVSSGMEREGEGEPRCARGPHQSSPATASPCAGKPNTPLLSPAAPHSEFRIPHSEFSWRSLPDGTLVDPARRLLALPWAGGEPPAPARKISVEGRDYLVFRY